jgi:hypothetical protein
LFDGCDGFVHHAATRRSIKQSLNLGQMHEKSPETVRNELWTTLLGYHLIRTTVATAALLHGKQPR